MWENVFFLDGYHTVDGGDGSSPTCFSYTVILTFFPFMILMESISLLESGLPWPVKYDRSYALGRPRVDSETPCSSVCSLGMVMLGIQLPCCEGAQVMRRGVCSCSTRAPAEVPAKRQYRPPAVSLRKPLRGHEWSAIFLITAPWEIISDNHLVCLVSLQNKR